MCSGMWAHMLTVSDYEDLINHGWRRSGMNFKNYLQIKTLTNLFNELVFHLLYLQVNIATNQS